MTARAVLTTASLALAGAIALATATPATAATYRNRAAQGPMCLDSSNYRANGTEVYQWQCVGNANQNWVVRDGNIVLKDTIGSNMPMCLDASNYRGNGVKVYQWQCVHNPNQNWVVRDGNIVLKDTID